MARLAAKVDANQKEIVDVLRQVGCFVAVTSMVGKGFPDILVGRDGKWFPMEIKDGNKPKSARQLTKDEQAWHEAVGRRAPVYVVESIEDALRVVGL